MKKILKLLKILILILSLNQIIILTYNNSLRKGHWKSISKKQLVGIDFLELDNNLRWNTISKDGEIIGIVQFYTGNKMLVSNLTLTEWYLYQHK